MNDFEKIILIMGMAVLFVGVSQKFRIPYPIVLVLGGIVLSFIPGLDFTYFNPNLVLLIVLPPILYYAAFWISYREFRRNFSKIFSLALTLVFVTTLVVGVIFKWCFPQYSWPLAFAFGAIVSPPDAASATAILRRFPINSRLICILEGESLVNDASALLLYKIAVTSLLAGTFSLMDAGLQFVQISVGGCVMGLVLGYPLQHFSRRFLNPVIGTIFSFLIPYITFITADLVGVSGVLAVVVSGLIGSHIIIKHQSSLRRVLGYTTWELFIIVLNCFIFILIGSQLDEMTAHMSWSEVRMCIFYSFLIWAAMAVVRLAWVYSKTAISSWSKKKNLLQSLREETLVGWAGMRGIVSLVAVLALPLTLPDATPIEGRSHLVFMTFMVIFFSLIVPALTLPWLISWLGIQEKPEDNQATKMRTWLAQVAQDEISHLYSIRLIDEEERNFLANYFQVRSRIWEIASSHHSPHYKLESARKKVLQMQRKMLVQIWENGQIDDLLLKTLERELDVEETNLARAEIN